MSQFCHQCGTQLVENARLCHQCGTPVVYPGAQPPVPPPVPPMYAQPPQPMYPPQPVPMYPVKPKIPGRGLSIASMVLGILGVVSGVDTLSDAIQGYEGFYDLIDDAVVFAALSILATVFGITALHKNYRRGTTTAGVTTGIVGMALLTAAIVVMIARGW